MEHGSNKHGPVRDESLAQQTSAQVQGGHDTRVEEWREVEPPADGEPSATSRPDNVGDQVPAAPPGMSPDDVEGRTRLARYLGRAALPADRTALLGSAEANGAPDEVVRELRTLPEQVTFHSVSEIWAVLGHGREDDSRRF